MLGIWGARATYEWDRVDRVFGRGIRAWFGLPRCLPVRILARMYAFRHDRDMYPHLAHPLLATTRVGYGWIYGGGHAWATRTGHVRLLQRGGDTRTPAM